MRGCQGRLSRSRVYPGGVQSRGGCLGELLVAPGSLGLKERREEREMRGAGAEARLHVLVLVL